MSQVQDLGVILIMDGQVVLMLTTSELSSRVVHTTAHNILRRELQPLTLEKSQIRSLRAERKVHQMDGLSQHTIFRC